MAGWQRRLKGCCCGWVSLLPLAGLVKLQCEDNAAVNACNR